MKLKKAGGGGGAGGQKNKLRTKRMKIQEEPGLWMILLE